MENNKGARGPKPDFHDESVDKVECSNNKREFIKERRDRHELTSCGLQTTGTPPDETVPNGAE